MKEDLISQPFLQSEEKARECLEKIRWPEGPICPHCAPGQKVYRLKVASGKREVLKCATCRKQFSVTVGTIFEDSHIPLHKWLTAVHLICASKKGMSALQLQRMLGLRSYKSAWFMAHRIRHAMAQGTGLEKLSGIVEADETYIGGKIKGWANRNVNKTPVFSLVQRHGQVRSFVVPEVTAKNLKTILREHVSPEARLMTDQSSLYRGLVREFASHDTVNHRSKEYVRGEAHVNTAENYFGLLKRGIFGVYHKVGRQHLHRYLAEFDFRYNNRKESDVVRAMVAIKQVEGKRLQYH
jgi:transposase-like protein